MSFTKIQTGRFGRKQPKDPKVTITKYAISFNAELIERANHPQYVSFYVDGANVLFVFSDTRVENSLKVTLNKGSAKDDVYSNFRQSGNTSSGSLMREIGDILTSYRWATKASYDAQPYQSDGLDGWIIDLRKPIISNRKG